MHYHKAFFQNEELTISISRISDENLLPTDQISSFDIFFSVSNANSWNFEIPDILEYLNIKERLAVFGNLGALPKPP